MLSNEKDIVNTCPSIFYNAFSNPVFIERLLIITYTIIFLIGIVGNIMTTIIIKYNTHLRTPTNLYLLNLAVSDLMMLICNLPLEMIEIHYREWPLSILFCRLRNICVEFFTCSSILTILAFSCERYFAIVHPMHFHRLNRFHRAKNIIIIIWCLSLLISVPMGFSYEIDTTLIVISPQSTTNIPKTRDHSRNLKLNETVSSSNIYCKSCVPKKKFVKLLSIIMITTSIFCFYLPMIIIGIIYIVIIKALHHVNKYEKHSNPNERSLSRIASDEIQGKKQTTSSTPCYSSTTHKENNTIGMQHKSSHVGSYSWLKNRARHQARKVVVKTLVAVVIAFFICYAPLYLQRVLSAVMSLNSNLNSDSDIFSNIMAYLYVISGITFYFGSIINPILYNLVSNKYQRAFRDLCCCRFTFKTRTNVKIQRKFFQTKHQKINSFEQKLPQDPLEYSTLKKRCLDRNHNRTRQLPLIIHPNLSDIPLIPANSPSLHSYQQEPQQVEFLRSNASLPKANVKYTVLRNFPWRENALAKNRQLTQFHS
ncbi:unnamed protein product [Rotaria magnacalcarata]|uniref:G-protein coupled receptors family 1 profile domain-containing protein n=1 Tax=Rotaria magnacalcarata TaxID=392030 RepID=A0A816MY79_9BILA|nr:unnamed protein product [Rotaria magnacalcarata]